MRKILKNQKGVNLVTLSVTVIIIMAILGIVLYNVRTNLGVQRLQSMQADIENLKGKVSNYYLQYGSLPILKQQDIDESILSDNVKTVINNNIDTGKYYVIDLSAMENVTLNYGEDYEKIKNESTSNIENLKDSDNNLLTDLYIINSVSHNIFYVEGIKYEGKMYYKEYQDVEDSDIGLSEIAFDTMEENWSPVYSTIKKYEDKNGDTAIIPAGFQVSRKEGEDTIENGLVLRDSNENEWVWIPVSSEDLTKMYEEDSTGWIMLGTEVNTKYKSIGSTLGNRVLNRTNPGLTDDPYYREPDVLSDSTYDGNANNRILAGFIEEDGVTANSLETMAAKLKEDYKDMIYSIKQNGGFYVGRYELSGTLQSPIVKKAQQVLTNESWYSLYKTCKYFTSNQNNLQSRMICGCQWDQVCRFINEHGDKKNLDDSRSYGNYIDSQDPANVTSTGTMMQTGFSNYWKANNIYDIAGNYREWTQEAYSTNSRAVRGRNLQ